MNNYCVQFVGPRKAEIREIHIEDPGPGQVQVRCLANIRSLGQAFHTYVAEFADYPLVNNWGYDPPTTHPLHYPGHQSGLLALEQINGFQRDWLRCPKGWASGNREIGRASCRERV